MRPSLRSCMAVAASSMLLALSACAAGTALTNSIAASTQSAASDINALAAVASDPNVQQAAKNLQIAGQAVVCYSADAAALTALIAQGAKQVKTASNAQTVYVATASLCAKVGGKVAVTL